MSVVLVIVAPVAHHLDDDCYRENQHVVQFLIFDLDPVSITQPEPLPCNRRDFAVAAVYDILEVEKVSDRFEIVGARHINCEAVAAEGEEITPDVGQHLTIAPNFVGADPIENLLLDVNELVPIQILKGEFVAQARELSPDLKCVASVDVLDRKVVAEGDELLLQYVLHICQSHLTRGGHRQMTPARRKSEAGTRESAARAVR
jgi:hypothetical protein